MKYLVITLALIFSTQPAAFASEKLSVKDVKLTLFTSCILNRVGKTAITTASLLVKSYSNFDEIDETSDGTFYRHASGATLTLQGTDTSHACTYKLPDSALENIGEINLIEAVKTSFISNYGVPKQVVETEFGEKWEHEGPNGEVISVKLFMMGKDLNIEATTKNR
jgi:hypothetical protein